MAAKGKPKKKVEKVLTIEEILDRKQPAVDIVRFLLDPEVRLQERAVAKKVGDAELALRRAERRDDPVPDEVLDDLAAAKKEHEALIADEEFAVFRLVAMGNEDLDDLMKAHRPTIQQLKEFQEELKRQSMSPNESLLYNPDTFPIALLAVCCESPALTLESAKALWTSDRFNRGELGRLFTAAWNVNQAISV